MRGVPDDEADEIRELLLNNEIDFFETPAGNWGISMPAIWLKDEHQLQHAKSLLAEYQKERLIRARAEYAQLRKDGKVSFITQIKSHPIRFIAYLAAIATIVYLSIKPFLDIGK